MRDGHPELLRSTRLAMLACAVPVLCASVLCCSGSLCWMTPRVPRSSWQDGTELLIWAALYGSLGLFGLAFGNRTLRLARSLVDPEEPLGSSFALGYRRTMWLFAVTGALLAAVVLAGSVLLALG